MLNVIFHFWPRAMLRGVYRCFFIFAFAVLLFVALRGLLWSDVALYDLLVWSYSIKQTFYSAFESFNLLHYAEAQYIIWKYPRIFRFILGYSKTFDSRLWYFNCVQVLSESHFDCKYLNFELRKAVKWRDLSKSPANASPRMSDFLSYSVPKEF